MKYINLIQNTCKTIKKHPYRFLLSILSDFILVVLSLGIFYQVFTRLYPHLEVMAGGLSGEMNPAFSSHYHAALGIIICFTLLSFIGFVVVKGSNYKLFVLDKKGYWRYMLRFLGVNVIWGLLLFLLLSFYLNFVFSAVMALNPLISFNAAGVLFYIACVAVVYFASISYVLIDNGFLGGLKGAFVVGVKKVDMLLWLFLVITIVVYFMKLIVTKYPLGGAVFGLVVLLPLIGLNRMVILEVVGKNKDKKK